MKNFIMPATRARESTAFAAEAVKEHFLRAIQENIEKAIRAGEYQCQNNLVGKTQVPDYILEECVGILRENGYVVDTKLKGNAILGISWLG